MSNNKQNNSSNSSRRGSSKAEAVAQNPVAVAAAEDDFWFKTEKGIRARARSNADRVAWAAKLNALAKQLTTKPSKADSVVATAAPVAPAPQPVITAPAVAAKPAKPAKVAAVTAAASPHEKPDISRTLVPAIQSGAGKLVQYLTSPLPRNADGEPAAPLHVQFATLRDAEFMATLSAAQKSQMLNSLVSALVAFAQSARQSQAARASSSAAPTPEDEEKERSRRDVMRALVSTSAKFAAAGENGAAGATVQASIGKAVAMSLTDLRTFLSDLDFLSLCATCALPMKRVRERAVQLAPALAADLAARKSREELDASSSADLPVGETEAVSATLSDRALRIAIQHYERLPGRVALLAQLADVLGGLNVLPKREKGEKGDKNEKKAAPVVAVESVSSSTPTAASSSAAAGGKKGKKDATHSAAAVSVSSESSSSAVVLPAPVDPAIAFAQCTEGAPETVKSFLKLLVAELEKCTPAPSLTAFCNAWQMAHQQSFAAAATTAGTGSVAALGSATTAVLLMRALDGKLVHFHRTAPRSSTLYVMPGVSSAALAKL